MVFAMFGAGLLLHADRAGAGLGHAAGVRHTGIALTGMHPPSPWPMSAGRWNRTPLGASSGLYIAGGAGGSMAGRLG